MNKRQFVDALAKLVAAIPLAPRAAAAQRTLLLQESPLAGFQYHAGESVWSLLAVDAALTLVREPDNQYDERAVRLEWNGHKLGFVPRLENTAVAQLLDCGEKLSARIVELKESSNPWERVKFAVAVIV